MIPKIIHLCWLSGDPFPVDIQNCLDSWKKHLTDYDIWLWGKAPVESEHLFKTFKGFKEINFDLDSTIWTHEAFEARKYAFAADHIRLYALYNYGGIYLDADVLVYKNFDELLELPYFVGHDQIRAFEAAVIGCEPHCPWIGNILKRYENRPFVKEDGNMDMESLPVVFHHKLIECGYSFRQIHSVTDFIRGDEKILNVFDGDFFNSRDAMEVRRTKKSFCAHNYAGSWQSKSLSNKDRIKKMLPKWFVKFIYVLGQNTWKRNYFSWYQIPFENK